MKVILEFYRAQKGSVIILFAVTLPVLVMVIGGVIDYCIALRDRDKIQQVADMATLAGLKVFSNQTIPEQYRVDRANQRIQQILNTQLAYIYSKIDQFNTQFDAKNETAVSRWVVNTKTHFLRIFDMPKISFEGTVTAKNETSGSTLAGIHVFVDVSQSMQVPILLKDRIAMRNAGPDNCEVMCHTWRHVSTGGQPMGNAATAFIENKIVTKPGAFLMALRPFADRIFKIQDGERTRLNYEVHSFYTTGLEAYYGPGNRWYLPSYDFFTRNTTIVSRYYMTSDLYPFYVIEDQIETAAKRDNNDGSRLIIMLTDGVQSFNSFNPFFNMKQCETDFIREEDELVIIYSPHMFDVPTKRYRSDPETGWPELEKREYNANQARKNLRKCAEAKGRYFEALTIEEHTAIFEEVIGKRLKETKKLRIAR